LSYSGLIDELRISTSVRHMETFARPAHAYVPDANTAALYHFDEGAGDVIHDAVRKPRGPSHGVRRFGGSPAGPEWVVSNAPFASAAVQKLTVALVAGSGSVAESAGRASFVLRLTTSDGKPSARAVTVHFSTADGTATAGSDYTAVSGTATFAAGSANGATFPVSVTILGDTDVEAPETFSLVLSNPAGAVLGSTPVETMTIVDSSP
jgi:hypothetical protein